MTVENAEILWLPERISRLFLAWNCHDCIVIKEALTPADIMFNDDIIGTDGQILTIFYTFNNNSARDILDHFGLKNVFTPALLTWDNQVITSPTRIVNYLEESGIIKGRVSEC
jgi:glutaredoxin-related protein